MPMPIEMRAAVHWEWLQAREGYKVQAEEAMLLACVCYPFTPPCVTVLGARNLAWRETRPAQASTTERISCISKIISHDPHQGPDQAATSNRAWAHRGALVDTWDNYCVATEQPNLLDKRTTRDDAIASWAFLCVTVPHLQWHALSMTGQAIDTISLRSESAFLSA